jgi:hypothetical protein
MIHRAGHEPVANLFGINISESLRSPTPYNLLLGQTSAARSTRMRISNMDAYKFGLFHMCQRSQAHDPVGMYT